MSTRPNAPRERPWLTLKPRSNAIGQNQVQAIMSNFFRGYRSRRRGNRSERCPLSGVKRTGPDIAESLLMTRR
jgi:hypothetical protein